MTDPTPLDLLCAAVPFHDADGTRRALVLRRLADTELYAALTAEPAGDLADLRMFDLPGGAVALACDEAAALADFLAGPVAHVAMPGRVLARELAGAGLGLLVNPGRPSEMLLDAAALAWLSAALTPRPQADDSAPLRLTAPRADALAILAEPLADRLADMAGLIAGVALVGTRPPAAGSQDAEGPGAGHAAAGAGGPAAGHLVVVAGAADQDHAAIAKALAELIAFLPPIDGGVDVTFQPLPLPPGAVTIEPPPLPDDTPDATPPAEAARAGDQPARPTAPPRLR